LRLSPILVLACLLALAGCGAVVMTIEHPVSLAVSQAGSKLSDTDIDDLRSGRIDKVRDRLEQKPTEQLSITQLALYCDILAKYREFVAARTCLDTYERRGGPEIVAGAVAGKRAVLALALGDPATAARLTEQGRSDGAVYMHALAEARLGNAGSSAAARATADVFAKQGKPTLVYYAVSLYSALGDNAAALRLLREPERGLLRYYGITASRGLTGNAAIAPLRVDLFDEFGFGLVNDYSFAPAANVYVEYLAAHSLLELGDLDEAARRLDALIADPVLPAYRDVQWLVFYDRGRVEQKRHHTAGARDFLERSVDIIESMRRSIDSDEGRIGFAVHKEAVYALLVRTLIDSGDSAGALVYAERARGRAFVDLLASRDDLRPSDVSAARAASLLLALRRAEGRRDFSGAAADPESAVRGAGDTEARDNLIQQSPSLAPLVSVTPVSMAGLRAVLSPDETAVAYFEDDGGWVAFVMSRAGLDVVRLPPTPLGPALIALNNAIIAQAADTDGLAVRRPAAAVYDLLIRPIEPLVHTRQLVIVPFDYLHYVPFDALYDGSQFLIEKYTLRQLPSLSAVSTAPRAAAGDGSLVIGNPTRDDAPPLPGAQAEAGVVARLLPSPTLLVRDAATIARFTALSSDKAFIHIASHGQFNGEHPLQSRLLLAAEGGSSGDLTVGDLYRLRLNARLVTLSACETAESQRAAGDDMIGLTRGFLFAGARNVIATMWQVSDAATGELMRAFYEALPRTHSVPEALQQAQIATMRRYPNPYYWAAFVPTSFVPRL
jgi:hypothetical protein